MDGYDPERFPLARFACPRCAAAVHARFAGPCPTCIDDLRAAIRGEAVVLDADYIPKSNVTPNAVALKDD